MVLAVKSFYNQECLREPRRTAEFSVGIVFSKKAASNGCGTPQKGDVR